MVRSGDLVVPVIAFGGIFQEFPVGKVVYYDNGVYHVDLCYNIESAPRIIRCCVVKKAN